MKAGPWSHCAMQCRLRCHHHPYPCMVRIPRFTLKGSGISHRTSSVLNVYTACSQKSLSFRKSLVQHTPFIIYNLLAVSWILSPHSALLTDTHKGDKEALYPQSRQGGLIEFALLVTFTFGKLGPRIILSRLTKSPFPWFNFGAFGPLVGGAVIVNLPFLGLCVLLPPIPLNFNN
jgi:ethanolaminephosphotransferase